MGQEKKNLEGRGMTYLKDGDVYEGDFVDKNQNGKGTYYYADESETTGDWKDNKPHGVHTYTNPLGFKYF